MGRNGFRHGQVHRGPEDACVVADVAAEEDEGVGVECGAGEAAEVADCVAGAVEEVEGAVVEVVEGLEAADFEGVGAGEVDFDEVAAALGGVSLLLLCFCGGGVTYA